MKIIVLFVFLTACFGDNNIPPTPDAPHEPTCMNRDYTVDPECEFYFGDHAPFGFNCDDGAERPVGPEYPPSCWLFNAKADENGVVYNLGKMCCTTEGPVAQ